MVGKYHISSNGGIQPRWRRDGRELYYIAPDGTLMAVEIKTTPRFEQGIPKALFRTRIFQGGMALGGFFYSPAADGRRFLINVVSESAGSTPITAVLNWTAGLAKSRQ